MVGDGVQPKHCLTIRRGGHGYLIEDRIIDAFVGIEPGNPNRTIDLCVVAERHIPLQELKQELFRIGGPHLIRM